MRLIIDIPESVINAVNAYSLTPSIFALMCERVLEGTPIPDNATVCDIEQIRDEIEERITDYILDEEDTKTAIRMGNVLTKVFEIIDKYINK